MCVKSLREKVPQTPWPGVRSETRELMCCFWISSAKRAASASRRSIDGRIEAAAGIGSCLDSRSSTSYATMMADAMLGSDTGQLKATYPETPEFASCCWMKVATFPTEGKSYAVMDGL
jgi:hypothetical protein